MKNAFGTMVVSIGLALSGIAGAGHAATLQSADWKTAGDGLLTTDGSGLEWLDVTETLGLTYNYVSTQFGAGGAFEGFRYAVAAEIDLFFRAAGWDGQSAWQASNDGITNYVVGFTGATDTIGTSVNKHIVMTMHTGLVGNSVVYSQLQDASCGRFCNPQGTMDSVYVNANSVLADTGRYNVASALVRTAVAPVPLPASLPLLLVAFGGLGIAARRRKTA